MVKKEKKMTQQLKRDLLKAEIFIEGILEKYY